MRKYLFYEGDIKPDNETVFVYGTNPENRHGAGAAIVAAKDFGALHGAKGKNNELQNKSYGIVTQDLRIYYKKGKKAPTISKEEIVKNIVKMFRCAKEKPNLQFKIAYRHLIFKSLSGYTGYEFMDMFNLAMKEEALPDNVVFSKEWYDTLYLNLNFYETA